jgi:hypothetical protein
VLVFLDGLEETRRRRDMVLSSAVAAGVVTAVDAWPEMFNLPDKGDPDAFPATDADMSAFRLEEATPESFEADIEAMVRASQQVTIREEDPLPFPVTGLPDTEWT